MLPTPPSFSVSAFPSPASLPPPCFSREQGDGVGHGHGHCGAPQPCSLILFSSFVSRAGQVSYTMALTSLPLISLAICGSIQILPNFSLTNDKKLGDIPLVGVRSVPDWLLPGFPRWRPIWAASGVYKSASPHVLRLPRSGEPRIWRRTRCRGFCLTREQVQSVAGAPSF